MSRKVPEWIGRTDDTSAPPRVRLRVFEAHNGRCWRTGRKIYPGDKWELDHMKPLIMGGENRESNLAPILTAAHKEKTREEMARKSKSSRARKKNLGIHQSRWPALPGTKRSGLRKRMDGTVERRDD